MRLAGGKNVVRLGKFCVWVLLVAMTVAGAAAAEAKAAPLTSVTVLLDWAPNTNWRCTVTRHIWGTTLP